MLTSNDIGLITYSWLKMLMKTHIKILLKLICEASEISKIKIE